MQADNLLLAASDAMEYLRDIHRQAIPGPTAFKPSSETLITFSPSRQVNTGSMFPVGAQRESLVGGTFGGSKPPYEVNQQQADMAQKSGPLEAVSGVVEGIKGLIKQIIGLVTGNERLASEAKAQQDKADAQREAAKKEAAAEAYGIEKRRPRRMSRL